MPPTFRSTTYQSLARNPASLQAWYKRQLPNHPFLLFGLPFLSAVVGGSFLLTPATALRYERHDRKVQTVTQEQALALPASVGGVRGGEGPPGGGNGGEGGPLAGGGGAEGMGTGMELGDDGRARVTRRGRKVGDLSEEYYRLAAKDIDNWEQRRVKRLPGERDGKL